MLLAVAQGREEPAGLAHDLLQGPPAGIGEIAVRVAQHPLGTIVVILGRDVGRHFRRLPFSFSVGCRALPGQPPGRAFSPADAAL